MFFELDFVSIILAIVTILLAWRFLDKLFVWFWEKTGIEFRHIRKRREEHELLMKTAENLSRLQEQHQEDVERVTQNDRKMQQEFSEFVEELKSALTAQREQMDIYAQNRINDREKSREVQRELSESIDKLAEGAEERKKQIKALMCGSMELLGDKIDQRFSKYVAMNGIPENEVSEFDGLFFAYKLLNGNHGREQKYKYVKEHLPVLPVEINPVYDEQNTEK